MPAQIPDYPEAGARPDPLAVVGLHIGRYLIHARGYAASRPAGTIPAECMTEVGELRGSAEAETATASVTTTSGARLLAASPLTGLPCRLLDDLGGEVFRGRCDRAELDYDSDRLTLSLVSEDQVALPLRRVSELVEVAPEGSDAVVPLRWGRVGGYAVQLDAAGRRWAWADHAVAGIDAVEADGVAITGWQYRDWQDRSGRTVALIELTAPAAEVYATGRGRYRSGGLIESPQAVMADLAMLAGLPEMAAQISRGDALAGLRIAGSIETETTARQALRDIADSCGLLWSPLAEPGVVSLPLVGPLVHYGGRIDDVRRASPPTRALVSYGRRKDGAVGEVTAILRDAERIGLRQQVEIALPWVTTAADALAVAERILRDASCDTATATGLPRRARIGDAVEIDGETWWIRELLGVGREASATMVSAPRFGTPTLTAQTTRAASAATVTTLRAQAAGTQVRIVDTSGQPIGGASVSVNGSGALLTDAGGVVSIPPTLLTRPVGQNAIVAIKGRQYAEVRL